MAPLRALSSALLFGAVLHCSATDTGEPTVEPESIITIPEKGLQVDEHKIVWLGPSKSLRVVDSTNAAVFMPQSTVSPSVEPSSEHMNAVAYMFENGACDFTKTVEYKKLFSDYGKALWDRSPPSKEATAEEVSHSPVANYTFTNPPAEVLRELVSFCVRFVVTPGSSSSSGSSEKPDEELRPPSSGVPGDSVEQGNGVPGEPASPGGPNDESPENKEESENPHKPPNPGVSGEVGENNTEDGEHHATAPAATTAAPPGDRAEVSPPKLPPQLPPKEPLPQHMDNGAKGDGAVGVAGPGALGGQPIVGEQDSQVSSPVGRPREGGAVDQAAAERVPVRNPLDDEGKNGARLRALSETAEKAEKYLTVVVHSASLSVSSWSAGGLLLIAAVLFLTY
ncbi:Toxoplasma gondii family A protein [Besnoitia besnoiti]|uniref:Toxoplasma gondii family A protein n=1 Tax=Besnoitia besnoiti TaxID=94643 RepID=A0A2A9MFG7_BESBE|nr:Toxoplasma gondii family A protein [Besnoitia besnoiti]PFH36735.1 Toxoplasma gondii family A protein [Besnoitia besnoiti]